MWTCPWVLCQVLIAWLLEQGISMQITKVFVHKLGGFISFIFLLSTVWFVRVSFDQTSTQQLVDANWHGEFLGAEGAGCVVSPARAFASNSVLLVENVWAGMISLHDFFLDQKHSVSSGQWLPQHEKTSPSQDCFLWLRMLFELLSAPKPGFTTVTHQHDQEVFRVLFLPPPLPFSSCLSKLKTIPIFLEHLLYLVPGKLQV